MRSSEIEAWGDAYGELVRPRVAQLLKLLKLDRVYERAERDRMVDAADGREIIDLVGGYGSTLLGHNPAELVERMKRALDSRAPVHAQASIRVGAVRLARKLNEMMARHAADTRGFVVTLGNSGAEAVEAALKHAFLEWSERRDRVVRRLEGEGEGARQRIERLLSLTPVVVAVRGSFHGKTAGSVSVTTNAGFRSMYSTSPLRVVFLERDEPLENARAKLAPLATADLSEVAAVILEAIQGEGGIVGLSDGFARTLDALAREHSAPLIADEIQCGLFRAGDFVAATRIGLKPDYVLFGKSLGGGLCKISALLVAKERYVEGFGLLHTSTFAEDELSSEVALGALEILDREAGEIRERGEAFEARVRDGVARISGRHPGVIREVRGRGFLLGIELDFTPEARLPIILDTVHRAGYATYVYSSYLLHRHGLRVGVTLSRPDTLRLEPSAWILPESVDRLVSGLADLASIIRERKLLRLTRHFWRADISDRAAELVSPSREEAPEPAEGISRVAFLCHVINDAHLRHFDPLLRAISREDRERFLSKFGAAAGPVRFHEQILLSPAGRQIHLVCYGVFRDSAFFERSLREGDGEALGEVWAMAERAKAEGARFIGLGQYTSIVSKNGLLLSRLGIPLTTGNALTAGFAIRGLERALAESGIPLKDARVGVVGARGNIGSAVGELLADSVGELRLVVREGAKRGEGLARVADRAVLSGCRVDIRDSLGFLQDCHAVVMATNSADSLLLPEHLARGAIVMDVSVPSNIDERVFIERPDVKCYLGGRARLPSGQSLRSDWLPVARGETYACLAETIAVGMDSGTPCASIGPVTREGIERALAIASRNGIELGSLKRVMRHA